MNVALPSLPNHPAAVGIATAVDELSAFLEKETAATIWQRDMPTFVQEWLVSLHPSFLPSGRIVLPADTLAETVSQMCDMSRMPKGLERDWLETDITRLAAYFATLLDTKFLRLRLDVVTHNACRKFHTDAITARLVCTYRGTGTQYGISRGGLDPDPIFTAPTGAPVLLRGTQWRPEPDTGLLHRSPPIEGTGETRLLLVLDPLNELEPNR